MTRLRRSLLLSVLLLVALPAAGQAATVSVDVPNGIITFNADPGEANTAVIVRQAPNVYFVGDQSPGAMVKSDSPECPTAPPPLPEGRICTVPTGVTRLVENLGDGDDTGVIGDMAGGPTGTINGGLGDDTLVGGQENDTFQGDAGTDTVAYVGIPAAKIMRTANVTAALPTTAGAATTGNGQTGESDTIDNDIEGLVGGNGSDILTGNDGPNTIVGAAPAGTPGGVDSSPAGDDKIDGGGGVDTLVAGDRGTVTGGSGADILVGGRSTDATTVLHGGDDNDTIVSGLGDDDIFGDAGANTLAYASIKQGGLSIVDRGTAGVTATLPDPGQTAMGGQTGGPESDTIHSGIGTLVGSNGDDVLNGSAGPDVLVGVAPAGTAGVAPGPPGNDTLSGGAGADLLLGAEGNDRLDGGAAADAFIAGAGNDTLQSRDGTVEAPNCGAGVDTVTADPTDKPTADCETVDTGVAAAPPVTPPVTPPATTKDGVKPRLTERPATLVLRKGRRVSLYLACRNEKQGCRGTFVIRTREKVRIGMRKARRYTLARVAFRIVGNKPKRYRIKLSATTLKLVRRHHSLKLTGTMTARDASGNRAKRGFRLRLKRP